MEKFIREANSRETSPEIMEAISCLADDYGEAVRIWEDPTEREKIAIWEMVTKNGLIPAEEFCWGVEGGNWADDITN